jgi:alpha-glucosidase (family GH31 glycosyl hydrolase)
MLFDSNGWIAPRITGREDIYLFAYGRDYEQALQAFYALSGNQPLLPKWALGNWWSRYYKYSAQTYLELMDRFDAENLPFSVSVIDMDWHWVETVPPEFGSGWTGYSWNTDLFPDPQAFLEELHRRGLRVTLNVHPADGVRAFENAYRAVAEAMGRNADDGLPIAFDATDKNFLDAYFDVLHRSLEKQGVDFWWIDWQQGQHSRLPGVDPLWVLNHYHFMDSQLDDKRPLTFSRYAGPGSHRYPVGFSGDTVISWASLKFQPEFTATASNIGYGWWSHDIGGHMYGTRDNELTARWFWLGVFSPINRLHSSSNPFLVKEPWHYPLETRETMNQALRLRHRLVPYLHTMNHRAAKHRLPLVRPMYHLYPNIDAAYSVPNQYMFGSQLLVHPITDPRDNTTLTASADVWLPEGTWVDVFTGTVYAGSRTLRMSRTLESIPVLMRSGEIVPLSQEISNDVQENPEALEVLVTVGADADFTLIEDDGIGSTIDQVNAVYTQLTWNQSDRTFTIHAPQGNGDCIPAARTWIITFLSVAGLGARHSVTVSTENHGSAQVVLDADPRLETPDKYRALFELVSQIQYENTAKEQLWAVVISQQTEVQKLQSLRTLDLPDAIYDAVAELLSAL